MPVEMINDSLSSIAEIAITLAGFTSVLAVLRSSRGALQEELLRIVYIFLLCISVVFCSFLPVIIETFSKNSELVWILPLVILGGVAVLISGMGFWQVLSGRIRLHFRVASYSMMLILLFLGLLMLGAAVRVSPGDPLGYLLLGQLWFVTYAGYLFVTTLFWAHDE